MPSSRPARPPRKRPGHYHHGDLRRALLESAVRTIRTHGVDGLTLRGVGSSLGVSRTALYRHFTDKAALLAAVAAEGFRMLREDLTAAWERAGHGREGLEAMGEAYVHFAVAHPSHYRVMFGADILTVADEALGREGEGSFQVLVQAITALQKKRLARRDDPQQMALFIWAAVHGVAMLVLDGRVESSAIDDLTRYATGRIRAAIVPGT